MKVLYCIDIDCTLTNARQRYLDAGPEPDRSDKAAHEAWVKLVMRPEAMIDDVPVPGMEALVSLLDNLVYVTARNEKHFEETKAWLALHGFPPADILMRASLDRRGAGDIKRDLIAAYKRPHEHVMVIDDDPHGDIEAMTRKEGWTFLKARTGAV